MPRQGTGIKSARRNLRLALYVEGRVAYIFVLPHQFSMQDIHIQTGYAAGGRSGYIVNSAHLQKKIFHFCKEVMA